MVTKIDWEPAAYQYHAIQKEYRRKPAWVVQRVSAKGTIKVVKAYPATTAGRKAATEVASRLDTHARLEL